jgi:osmotically-inducible protein OsmY
MNRHISIPGLLCAMAIAAGTAACSTLREPAHPTAASSPQDSAIARNVRDQLATEVPTAGIDVKAAQGKVELSGTVEDADAARRAVKGALAVDGVRGVVNDLDVAPEDATHEPALSASTL